MKRITFRTISHVAMSITAAAFTGCGPADVRQMQADEQTAERIYAATTQATAVAKIALGDAPPGLVSPATAADARRALAAAEQAQRLARAVLDLARAALDAAAAAGAAGPR